MKDFDRKVVGGILNVLLANESVLAQKTRNFHWNIKGPNFGPLHSLFGEEYDALDEIIDLVAERARALQQRADGSFKEFLDKTHIDEDLRPSLSEREMLKALCEDHETLVAWIRKISESCGSKHDDKVTENFLQEIAARHEKMCWMLRSHLE